MMTDIYVKSKHIIFLLNYDKMDYYLYDGRWYSRVAKK